LVVEEAGVNSLLPIAFHSLSPHEAVSFAVGNSMSKLPFVLDQAISILNEALPILLSVFVFPLVGNSVIPPVNSVPFLDAVQEKAVIRSTRLP
jgi:hypothetical protein